MKHSIKEIIAGWVSAPWYPLLFSLLPILTLLDTNAGQVHSSQGVRPALASLLLALVVYAVLFLVLRNLYRAAFLALLWLALFFSYGHFRILIPVKYPDSGLAGQLLWIWLILAILFLWWATRPGISFTSSAGMLNIISLGLVISLMVQIVDASQKMDSQTLGVKNAPLQEDLKRPSSPPDVYYIILDSYGRNDLLRESYGYDNGPFTRALQERGFYVAECSQSNYVRTELSLGSSLNMSYLQGLDPAFVPESRNRPALWRSLKHSAARYNFEQLGYLTIGFATGFEWNEVEDADLYLVPPLTSMTEFETLFMYTTLGFHAREWGLVNPDEFYAQNYRNRTLFVFDMMDDIARMPEPTFAYIHVMSPHPPFVFGPDGEPTDPAEYWNEERDYTAESYARGYQNQLSFLNQKLLSAVDTLLAESDVPPIIILQGDHGPWFQQDSNRFKIFNAYYLPESDVRLYPEISPVNTFRVIFDAYFGGRYGIFPDVSYFSPVPELFEFSEIPNPCVQ